MQEFSFRGPLFYGRWGDRWKEMRDLGNMLPGGAGDVTGHGQYM